MCYDVDIMGEFGFDSLNYRKFSKNWKIIRCLYVI